MVLDAMRNGSTCMSSRRVMAPGASLVCRVDRTRWPVSDASLASKAVSRSRTSPTMTMSGSCRSTLRRTEAKPSPDRGLISIWVSPRTFCSTGSSMVTMFFSAELSCVNAAYSVVDLPEPVGPVTRISPYGREMSSSNRARSSVEKPSLERLVSDLVCRAIRSTTFSP